MKKSIKDSGIYRVLSALVCLFIGLCITSSIFIIVTQATGINSGKIYYSLISVVQNILVFILPAIICAKYFTQKPLQTLRANQCPTWSAIAIVVMMYIISIPMMNWLVDWNSGLSLPESMSGIEQWMRNSENDAQKLTDSMLKDNGFFLMIYFVVVIGVLTGIGEEFFFRGSMLGSMVDCGHNKHLWVWVIGILFSAFHFQFFGFFPRMILGVWLGYLFVWSGSIWVPIIAHALNNSMVVIATYLSEQGLFNLDAFNNIGVVEDGSFPLLAAASAIASVAIAIFANRVLNKPTKVQS